MNQLKNRIVRIPLLLALIFCFALSAMPLCASATDDFFSHEVTGGYAVVLYDKTHDRYLVEQNADHIVNTSTSAKVMTGLIACELLYDRLDEQVTVTEAMLAETSGYSMKLKVGERLTVKDLLYGALCASCNDAAYVLAHLCGGDTQGFTELMNNKALSLGARSTQYKNPLGYPDMEGMSTTAYDTLKIALAASENELYMSICSSLRYTVPETNKSEERTLQNRNYLLSSSVTNAYLNTACEGMNAGNSGTAGGWSIITLAHDDGADYICVLLGGKESEDGSHIYAYDSVNSLLREAFDRYDLHTLYPAGAQLGETKIGLTGIGEGNAPYLTASALEVYAPDGAVLTTHIELHKDLKAPLNADDVVGKVTVSANGEKIGEADLVLKDSYEVNSLMLVIDRIGQYTKSRAFLTTIICFAVLLTAVILKRRFCRFHIGGRK